MFADGREMVVDGIYTLTQGDCFALGFDERRVWVDAETAEVIIGRMREFVKAQKNEERDAQRLAYESLLNRRSVVGDDYVSYGAKVFDNGNVRMDFGDGSFNDPGFTISGADFPEYLEMLNQLSKDLDDYRGKYGPGDYNDGRSLAEPGL